MKTRQDKPDALAIRQALKELRIAPQRFWTWLTGIALPEEMGRQPWTPAQHHALQMGVAMLAAGLGMWSAQTLYLLAPVPVLVF